MDKRAEFATGYKKPPRHTQFKPGQSGNPAGRPKKKAATFAELIQRELNTVILATEGGKQQRITKIQAIAKQQTNRAVSGDLKATALLMRALEPRESEQMDNLSPVLQEMRAIHAKHQLAGQNDARAAAACDSDGNLACGHTQGPNHAD